MSGCHSLEKIIIPPIIDHIEYGQFNNFTKLKAFTIPSSVKKINACAFCKCTSITKIEIPSSVEIIESFAFSECSSLVDFIIPNSVKQIGKGSFKCCNLLKSITLSSSLISIEESLFEGCSSLEKIVIPSSVKSIGEFAFYECQSLKEVIKFSAFNGCSSLEIVSFESNSNLATIEFYAFENCLAFQKIEIPSSVTSIRRFAFKDCKSLNEIVFDPSIQIIQNNAFEGCTSLDLSLIPSSAQNKKIPPSKNPVPVKVILLGDSAVGKSCILKRYAENEFKNSITATIGVEFKTKIVDIDGNQVKLQIWDTAGIERFHSITKAYYRNTHCAIIIFDLTLSYTIDGAIKYFNEIIESNGIFPIIFLGNKCDLNQYRAVDDQKIAELEKFEKRYKTKYFEVSAKYNENLEDAIQYAVTESFY